MSQEGPGCLFRLILDAPGASQDLFLIDFVIDFGCLRRRGLPQQGFHGRLCYSSLATTRFPWKALLQHACHNKVSIEGFSTAGLPRQSFHKRLCYSRLATAKFPQKALLQQVCRKKVSTEGFATAGLPKQGFYIAKNKVSTEGFATAALPQQGFPRRLCYSRLATTRFPLEKERRSGLPLQVC